MYLGLKEVPVIYVNSAWYCNCIRLSFLYFTSMLWHKWKPWYAKTYPTSPAAIPKLEGKSDMELMIRLNGW